jgi:hypothetical protein
VPPAAVKPKASPGASDRPHEFGDVRQDAAISIQPDVVTGVLYFRNALDITRYLSPDWASDRVGFYAAKSATDWTLEGPVLSSLYSNARLYWWSSADGYVYANAASAYTPLTVRFQQSAETEQKNYAPLFSADGDGHDPNTGRVYRRGGSAAEWNDTSNYAYTPTGPCR